MANIIVIEQGDRELKDVTKITPSNNINKQIVVKYPNDIFDGTLISSRVSKSWVDEDEVIFTDPDVVAQSEPGPVPSVGAVVGTAIVGWAVI